MAYDKVQALSIAGGVLTPMEVGFTPPPESLRPGLDGQWEPPHGIDATGDGEWIVVCEGYYIMAVL